jgi:hypothetical protein
MSEFEQDPQVAGLLLSAADEAATYIRPRGVDTVVRTVRRRRATTMGAAAVVLAAVVTPLTVLGLTGRHAPNTPTGNDPSTSASASPSDSASSSLSGPAGPDGRIPADQLRNSTLNIPAWPNGFADSCPTGPVKFTGGKAGQDGRESLQGDPVYVDADRDGAAETVILVACGTQGTDYQVVALDREATGKIVTLGRVVGSAGNTGKAGSDIMTIWAIEPGDNGQVRVDVGEYRPCCEAVQASQHQWRVYGWNGSRFTQTGGPTAFGPNPNVTDLVITADSLTMTRQDDGSWAGTLRVTIHNAASFTTPGSLRFYLGIDATWQAQPGPECRFTPGETPLNCSLPSLAAGASKVLTVRLHAPAGPLSTRCDVLASSAGYPDRKPDGASATVRVIEG